MNIFAQPNSWADRKLLAIKAAGQSKTKPFVFMTSCVDALGPDVNEMCDNAQEITLRTLRRYCDTLTFEKELDYHRDSRQGLVLIKDWGVRYWKSTYQGCPCYYIDHSGIEYIWVDKKLWQPKIVKPDLEV